MTGFELSTASGFAFEFSPRSRQAEAAPIIPRNRRREEKAVEFTGPMQSLAPPKATRKASGLAEGPNCSAWRVVKGRASIPTVFFSRAVAFSCLLLSAWGLVAFAEPEASSEQLPRLAPSAPEDALRSFRIKKGFRVEAVATEPQVVDPVSMSFDAAGRLYVVEMRGYSERRDDKLGRIRLLEDEDGDGRYEKATVFADGLAWPTAVHCYDGGVFVAVTPDLLFLRDADGDGVADERRVAFTGFGEERSRLNVQALPNSFRWGPDNRIHGVTSSNGARLRRPDGADAKPLRLNGRDFSFDPRALRLRAESGGGQHGACFDDFGRRYVSSNSNHLQAIVYDGRYAANPRYAMPAVRRSVAADGGAAPVFRISPDEPWRIVRTRWRIAGKVRGPVEGGGRVSGYFTAATGVAIYRGDAFPESFRGNAFVADAGSNLVHRKVIRAAAAIVPRAERPADERETEFLASPDNWFRPVQLANGPDGCLYVLDMCREVIEHPWSLPPGIKKHVDLNHGNDRGRIWRIVPDGFVRPVPPRLSEAAPEKLAATLASPNAWLRETAARLLYERGDPQAASVLVRQLKDAPSPVTRLSALNVLAGLERLKADHLLVALRDKHPALRERALKLAESFPEALARPSPLSRAVLACGGDSSARVLFQWALTLSVADLPGEPSALLDLLETRTDDWIRAAATSALAGSSSRAFSTLRERGAEPEAVLALAADLQSKGDALDDCSPDLLDAVLFPAARKLAADESRPPAERLRASRLLANLDPAGGHKALLPFLDVDEPDLRLAAIETLTALSPEGLSEELLSRWKGLDARARDEVLGFLLRNPEGSGTLLDVLEDKTVAAKELPPLRLRALRALEAPALRKRVAELLGPEPVPEKAPTRDEILNDYRPALALVGDPTRGQVTFRQRCASCHRAASEGFLLGPDLAAFRAAGAEKILANLIDPNREVAADYAAFEIRTKEQAHLGLLTDETPTHLTIRFPFGKSVTIERKRVLGMKSLPRSLMPEGLEAGLDHQAMADLLAFLAAPAAPAAPRHRPQGRP